MIFKYHKNTFEGIIRVEDRVYLWEWKYGQLTLISDDKIYDKHKKWLIDMFVGRFDEDI